MTPARQNPIPFLIFMGIASLVLLGTSLWLILSGEDVVVGSSLIGLTVISWVALRIAWIIGSRRGL
jgi:hypothetical protein